jgi:predicted ester cyclase
MKKGLIVCGLAAVVASTVSFAAETMGDNKGVDNNEALFRENAPKFHRNFSNGDFDKNGDLVTDDIDVDSNNVKLTGRDNFVNRLKRYSVPFPGLQLKDRILIVDGNKAAVNYVLQGEQKGPYGNIPATGNKIEAMSGEVFEFNDQGLMKKLTTITELDRVTNEVKGTVHIGAFQNIMLLPVKKESSTIQGRNRSTAAKFDEDFNSRHENESLKLVATNVTINADNAMSQGKSAFAERFRAWKSSFPDMTIHDEYVIADGDRAAVEYIVEGTQTGPYTAPDGAVIPPTGKRIAVRGIEFMKFNQAGLLSDLVVVHNENDVVTQLTK